MSTLEHIIMIAVIVAATVITRFIPFIIFRSDRPTPEYIKYLGTALPSAVFGMLVIYSLKSTSLTGGSHGIPEFIGIAVTVALHLIFRKMLVSIACGTVCYMILVQLIF